MIQRLRIFAACSLSLFLLTSCSGYRLGSMLPPTIKTVYVPVATNETDEPLLEITVTQETLRAIQRDGSLQVVDEKTADSILRISITDVKLTALRYEDDNRVKPGEQRMTIRADIELVRTEDDIVIARQSGATGKAIFEIGGDLTASKREAFPEVSRDLAQDIVEKITEAWPDTP